MNSEFSQSFQFELSDETIENLKKIIKPSEPVKELTIGIDYGNGKNIQATGNFKNINFKYKKRKRGKNYKLFKEANDLAKENKDLKNENTYYKYHIKLLDQQVSFLKSQLEQTNKVLDTAITLKNKYINIINKARNKLVYMKQIANNQKRDNSD